MDAAQFTELLAVFKSINTSLTVISFMLLLLLFKKQYK